MSITVKDFSIVRDNASRVEQRLQDRARVLANEHGLLPRRVRACLTDRVGDKGYKPGEMKVRLRDVQGRPDMGQGSLDTAPTLDKVSALSQARAAYESKSWNAWRKWCRTHSVNPYMFGNAPAKPVKVDSGEMFDKIIARIGAK